MFEEKVYNYTVYWQSKPYVFEYEWKRTSFAKKKDAQRFARKVKDKKHKPYPYIVRTIAHREYFRADVEVELVKDLVKRKVINY